MFSFNRALLTHEPELFPRDSDHLFIIIFVVTIIITRQIATVQIFKTTLWLTSRYWYLKKIAIIRLLYEAEM